ncbi:hypothetical protein QBC37DRAFT_352799 [Rhypophila decipiens]|uniref:FAD-binding PCMH-type domain-containing protein n=1 Tax=Rhypophila decipiens TaxID=261697 RepID=A0AAN6XY73_9PEZI|nr:hypothetical protein QBC37DRAFT_352799 [Rhypophila decipiens]
MSTTLPRTYPDPEYEQAHVDTYERNPRFPIKPARPPGVREEDFLKAIDEFITVVGKDAVFIGEGLSDYIDPYDIHEADNEQGGKRQVPSAAVCPHSTQELKQILTIATTYAIPLWPFSRGKNLGYGGPAPRLNGSIALDLHLMNRIIEVNDTLHYAVVEPGVTFADLYQYCTAHSKKVWPSTASLGWGSVLGNALDRGCGFGANFSHHQSIAALEVMLPSGEIIRTGQWGLLDGNSPNSFLSKFTYGPSIEGLFLQSNMGVVTKMGLWLTPQPKGYMSCSFSMPAFEDIELMVDIFGEMRRDGTIPGSVVWFTSLIETLCISGRREDYWAGEGPIPDWRLEELRQETGHGHWFARWGLYGPKRVVQAQFDEINAVLASKAPTGTIKGVLYADEDGIGAASIPAEDGLMFVGVPAMWSLPLINWPIPKSKTNGKPAHGDYAPIIPSDGKAVLEWMRLSKPICEANGVELMADFFMHERHVVLMNMFTWDQTDEEQKRRVERLYWGLYGIAKERGYGMYRAHVNHMDLIADLNDFGNHAYNRFVEKIKDAVDPNGILAPGKQGIWPNRFRHFRETQEFKQD